MKAYQCSKCEHMKDYDEFCLCAMEIDPKPKHRENGDKEKCLEAFEPVKKEWHEKFSWEK